MREANGPAMEPISNTAHLLQPLIDRAVLPQCPDLIHERDAEFP